jgi:NADH-quinone oxidoreductase subunit K
MEHLSDFLGLDSLNPVSTLSVSSTLSGIDLTEYLALSVLLFFIGISGIFLNRKNIIILLMSIELMLLSINLTFIVFSVFLDDIVGQVFALFVLTVAAAESAIGLALLVVYYRVRGSISIASIRLMRG